MNYLYGNSDWCQACVCCIHGAKESASWRVHYERFHCIKFGNTEAIQIMLGILYGRVSVNHLYIATRLYILAGKFMPEDVK